MSKQETITETFLKDLALPRPLFEAILAQLPIGIAIAHHDGRMLFVNEAARRFADVTPAQGRERAARSPALDPRGDARLAAAREAGHSPEAHNGTECRVGERALRAHRQRLGVGQDAYFISTLIDVTDDRRVEEELFRRAYFDELTGLPNRGLMEQQVEELIARRQTAQGEFALAFIDVDNFKHINDYYGHAAGDALLVKMAQRISGELRPSDMLARVGGDEFVLLVSPVADAEGARRDVAHVLDRLKQPFHIDGHEIFSSASIGVSLFPLHGDSYEKLRRNADVAMYRVKSEVKGNLVLFDEKMGSRASARMELEQRLRLAIRDRRFCCAFQPKVNIRTREIIGIEVLLRWRDERGLIQAPGDFVNLAVELGLMNEITYLVLQETVDSLGEINDVFGERASISVNVAARQADDFAFMKSFIEALTATGCAERFIIEVTEEAFFAKSSFQTKVLPLLRAAGARVSIDDFGVGYSSLAALADIEADEIKVDRSFITDVHKRPRSQSILKAIESLGQALNMSIIVEGVETFEELAYLQAATHIRYAQGYYFARPVFLGEVARAQATHEGARVNVPAREAAAIRSALPRDMPLSKPRLL